MSTIFIRISIVILSILGVFSAASAHAAGSGSTPSDGETELEFKIIKKGAPEEMQERIDYAWDVSGHDKRFIFLLEAENGSWSEDTKSSIGYWRWDKASKSRKKFYDYGICQISEFYHKAVVEDERFQDWRRQVEVCRKKYKGGTKFYGVARIPAVKGRFYTDWVAVEEDGEEAKDSAAE